MGPEYNFSIVFLSLCILILVELPIVLFLEFEVLCTIVVQLKLFLSFNIELIKFATKCVCDLSITLCVFAS